MWKGMRRRGRNIFIGKAEKEKIMIKSKIATTILCAVMTAAAILSGCGKREDYAGNEISYKYKDENTKMIAKTIESKEEYINQAISLLEKIEPGCRIISADKVDELERGSIIRIQTEEGSEYMISIFTDGGVGNIADKNTGETLFPSDQLPRDDDADSPLPMDINTGFLMIKGISKENAQKIAEVLDHGAPNGLISEIDGYKPENKDIRIVVHMETGKAFLVTVLDENERNATISDY